MVKLLFRNGGDCYHVSGECRCPGGWTGLSFHIKHCPPDCPAVLFISKIARQIFSQPKLKIYQTSTLSCHTSYILDCERNVCSINIVSCSMVRNMFSGEDCGRPCPPGKFGPNCVHDCYCHNGNIQHISLFSQSQLYYLLSKQRAASY